MALWVGAFMLLLCESSMSACSALLLCGGGNFERCMFMLCGRRVSVCRELSCVEAVSACMLCC